MYRFFFWPYQQNKIQIKNEKKKKIDNLALNNIDEDEDKKGHLRFTSALIKFGKLIGVYVRGI